MLRRRTAFNMDRITKNLLDEFSNEMSISHLPEDKRFEHFACYLTVRKHYGQSFSTDDLVMGSGGDGGIDAIGIIVNGTLVSDPESIEDQFGKADYIEATFVFVQAERSSSFDSGKLGTFSFGVKDFFEETPKLVRNRELKLFGQVVEEIFKKSGKFIRGRPNCRLYYVTTGKWVNDANLIARRDAACADILDTKLFSEASIEFIDADRIMALYNQSRTGITKEFEFVNRTDIPRIPGVDQAYLGFLPAQQFLPLITDDSGELLRSVFYDNVRDFQDYNEVNSEIKDTLTSEARSRFVLMNNGVTIIARSLVSANARFTIGDYQIVNGCQTSHVVFEQAENLDSSVMIPVRLIGTQDEEIIQAIVRATNRQTEVKEEQFIAFSEFTKKLEAFFGTFDERQRLYFERRSGQYNRVPIEKTRVITQQTMIRTFAAMILREPHRTVKSYKSLSDRVGDDIFDLSHKLELYHASAFAYYKLEFYWRASKIDLKYKVARYQIIMAMFVVFDRSPLPPLNSRNIEKRASSFVSALSQSSKCDEIIGDAVKVIEQVSGGNLDRDSVNEQRFTEAILQVR
jgi:hypothetical protein